MERAAESGFEAMNLSTLYRTLRQMEKDGPLAFRGTCKRTLICIVGAPDLMVRCRMPHPCRRIGKRREVIGDHEKGS